jgi:hypothetical protein
MAIRKNHDYPAVFLRLAFEQRDGARQGVIQISRTATRLETAQGGFQLSAVLGQVLDNSNLIAVRYYRSLSLWPQHQAGENRTEGADLAQQRLRGAICFHHNDRFQLVLLQTKLFNALAHPVVKNLEVFLLQVENKVAFGVNHRNRRGHEVRRDPNLRLDLGRLGISRQVLLGLRGQGVIAGYALLGAGRGRQEETTKASGENKG